MGDETFTEQNDVTGQGVERDLIGKRCHDLMDRSLSAADRLERLGALSERLTEALNEALDDKTQFKRYIVAEKSKNRDGDPVTESVEKVFGKVDFKSMKEAAGAIRAVADSVKAVYSVPDFSELSDVCSGGGGDADGIVVTFENGSEYAV
ncbi:MAG: hypothetical protein IJS45_02900 [Clostridia bacterium]|nr:hypothetical protein [Clostridia bacterium]